MTHDEMAAMAVRVVAEHSARKMVRERLRQRGVKLSYVPAREIIVQAKAWLREHPEIIAEARAKAATLGYGPDIQRAQQSHNHLLKYACPAAEKSTSVSGLADRGDGTMHEEETETCTLTFDDVQTPPRNYVWQDVMRHSNACEMLARQAALKEAGPDWPTYFAKHRERLMNEASDLIARSPGLARWRFR
jgi:hypothetical protein